MLLSLIIIVFVILMAVFWYTQGLFSAFLHLLAVIAAGTIAFAVWEPAAHALLATGAAASHFAWGLSLIGGFFFALVIIRFALDWLIPGNVQFVNLVNLIGGGLCGLFSGILTAGVMVIGLGFLPLPITLMGHQPYGIGLGGQVDETGSTLWLPVDRWAGGFFSTLAAGSMHPIGSDANLATHRPDMHTQAALFRLRYDENASLVANPQHIQVNRLLVQGLPHDALSHELLEALGLEGDNALANKQIVVVENAWAQHPAAYDRGTLRLSPVQVQLITAERDGLRTTLHRRHPVAYATDDVQGERQLRPFVDERSVAWTSDEEASFAFAFIVPRDEQPRFLMLRQLRFALDDLEPVPEAGELVAALGRPPEPDPDDEPSDGEPAVAADGALALTSELPEQISMNHASGLRYEGNAVISGRTTVSRFRGRMDERVRVRHIYHPRHQRMVRLEADLEGARSLLGRAVQTAERIHGITIEDHRGQQIPPIASVWHKQNGEQEINVNLDVPIRSATQLPSPASMRSGDKLYLYFVVSPGVTITRYHLGPDNSHEVNLPVN